MKKRLLVLVAVAALLSVGMYASAVAAPAAHAARANHIVLRESGFSAGAHYTGTYKTDLTDCVDPGTVSWVVDYEVSTGTIQTSEGQRTGPMVWAHVGEFCTGEESFQAFADQPTPISASDVQIDPQLHTAALLVPVNVTVIVSDGNALPWGTAITLHVKPTTWTGVGRVTTGFSSTRERFPGGNLLIRESGQSRSASVEGGFSYTAPWNDVTLSASDATSVSGDISNSRSLTIIVVQS